MKALLMVWIAVLLAPVAAAAASAPPPTRRFAVVAGANRGPPIASPCATPSPTPSGSRKVVTAMGGVASEDCVVLREPTRVAFLDALAAVSDARGCGACRRRARGRRRVLLRPRRRPRADARARDAALHGAARSPWPTSRPTWGSRSSTPAPPAPSPASRAGGRIPAFLTDASSQVKGYAFLTSSSENEAAQESERLQGSFFTQALLTGLRGAADVSGDGQVTLGEAYQFAFAETLAQTTSTAGAAPSTPPTTSRWRARATWC